MWHEARKQEKKIRGMMVDYKKRAERRREFYEKTKADPTQFLQLHGRKSKIYVDPTIATAADSPANMMPWLGQTDNLIDRFDVRAHLDHIPEVSAIDVKVSSTEDTWEERQVNYERYRILVQNEFLGVSEEKFLHQIHLEEQFGFIGTQQKAKEDEKKKLAEKKAAIAYTYEDSTPQPARPVAAQVPEPEQEEDDEDVSDIDFDLNVDVNQIGPQQAHEINQCGTSFGMVGNDFYSLLTRDLEEQEALRLAREHEEEKAMYSGRKSRRERRAFREKRLLGRKISPPSYAARESPTYDAYRKSMSKSRSRSHSPVNSGQITYITSFGGEDSEEEDTKVQGPAMPASAVKKKALPVATVSAPRSNSEALATHTKAKPKSRSRSPSPKHKSTRRRASQSPDSRRRSRSRDRRRSRGRISRSRRSRSSSRSRRRSRSRSWSRSRSHSRSRRRRSRHRGRRHRSSSSHSSSSSSRSSSRSSDSSVRSRHSKRHSSMSSSSSSSRSRSTSVTRLPHRSPSPRALPAPPLKRYYGRKKEDSDSSGSVSDMEVEDDSSTPSALAPSANKSDTSRNHNFKSSPSVLGNSGAGTKSRSSKNTPQELLKKKMQALLNRQYKADKKAEREKKEKAEQERQDREEELREISQKLRRKMAERERRMQEGESDEDREDQGSNYDSRSGSPNSHNVQTTRRSRSSSSSRSPRSRRNSSPGNSRRQASSPAVRRSSPGRRNNSPRRHNSPPPRRNRSPSPPRRKQNDRDQYSRSYYGSRDRGDSRYDRDRNRDYSSEKSRSSRRSRDRSRSPRRRHSRPLVDY